MSDRDAAERPRILVLCDHFQSDPRGGAERATLEVLRRLAGSEVVAHVIGGRRGSSESTTVEGIPTTHVRGLDLGRLLRVEVMVVPGLWRTARRLIAELQPTALVAAGLHFHSSRVAARLARRHSIPLVTVVHVGTTVHLSGPTGWAARRYGQTVGKRILTSSSQVVAVSEDAARHAAELGATEVAVIPNGVDHARFTAGARSGPTRFAFVGRLIANKGPLLALEAFAPLAAEGATMVFAGDGPQARQLARRVTRLGLRGSVDLLGHRTDVARILQDVDVLVRPSATEGHSLAILEAMASSVCVIASDLAANREMITDGETGLLHEVGSGEDLARALRQAMDTATRRRLAKAAHATVTDLTWERSAAALGAVIAGVERDAT